MPTVGIDIVFCALVLGALAVTVRWWKRRGYSLVGCLVLLAAIAAIVGVINLWTRFESRQNAAGGHSWPAPPTP